MGVDCMVIAKFKDGTYRHRILDRINHFKEIEGHSSIYLGEPDRFKPETYAFPIGHAREWSIDRIRHLKNELSGEEWIHPTIHIAWINTFLDFLDKLEIERENYKKVFMRHDPLEWVGLFSDNDFFNEEYNLNIRKPEYQL